LNIIGVREGHEITTGKAILAVLLPVLVIFGLIFIAIFAVIMFVGSMGFLVVCAPKLVSKPFPFIKKGSYALFF